jgi:hypothetical protein
MTSARISTSNLFPIMGMNFFKKFDKVLTDSWRSYNYEEYHECLSKISKTGTIPKTLTPKEQLSLLAKKHNIPALNEIQKCMKSTSAIELNNNQAEYMTKVNEIPGLNNKLKTEVNKLIINASNTQFGIHHEKSTIDQFTQITGKTVDCSQQAVRQIITQEISSIEWTLVGKIDGRTSEGEVIEIKNRTKKLFNELRNYEEPQIMTYLYLFECSQGYMVESLKTDGEININVKEIIYKQNYYEDKVYPSICKFIKFFEIFKDSDEMKNDLLLGNEEKLYKQFLQTK